MRIEHVAIWTRDLEGLRAFYETYFEARAGAKYANPATGFESYFLAFASGGRLELMRLPSLAGRPGPGAGPMAGYAHLAISLGSTEEVDALASRLRADGLRVVDGPRFTGDGYYECVVLDPDGNRLELTV
jgi:lactoylglutathione lyase